MRLLGSLQRIGAWVQSITQPKYTTIDIDDDGTSSGATRVSQQTKDRIRSLYTVPLIGPLCLWILLFVFFQHLQPWWKAYTCNFEAGSNPYNILLVADPQLIDNHTYPSYPAAALELSKFTVDNYIYKNYWSLVKHLHPDSIVFLGDLLDNGRESSDEYYEVQYERFERIFKTNETRVERGIDVHTDVTGNHDIGFGNGVHKHAVDRFLTHFGQPNNILERRDHDLVTLNTIALSNTKDEAIWGPPKKFLESISAPEQPRILFDHVPLWRDPKKATCGPSREQQGALPAWAGVQYQTLIEEKLTDQILKTIQPDIIFSGDDHDYCEVLHEYEVDGKKRHAIEINVKSISMAMGIWKPAVELLSLYDQPTEGKKFVVNGQETDISPTFSYKMCYLPTPYMDIMFYAFYALINFIYLCIICRGRPSKPGSSTSASIAESDVYREPSSSTVFAWIKRFEFTRLVKLCLIETPIVLGIFYMMTIHGPK